MTFNITLDKIFNNLKKSSPFIIAIDCTSGLILFLPEDIRQKLYISHLSEQILTIIGIIFIFAIFLTITILCQLAFSTIKKKITKQRFIQKQKKFFLSLSPTQKSIIKELLTSNQKYIIMNITDGNANYLLQAGFLHRPAQSAMLDAEDFYGINVKFLPQPWLMSAYNKDPEFFLKN